MNPKLLIVQPYLTAYRLPVFAEMASEVPLELASSPPPPGSGFGTPEHAGTRIREHHLLPECTLAGGRLFYQVGLPTLVWQRRPSNILIAANPRNLSLWLTLILGRLLGLKCYAHGQALYDRGSRSALSNKVYWLITRLARRYICYTRSGLESLQHLAPPERLAVAENSLVVEHSLPPAVRSTGTLGILFIGRLREASRPTILVQAVAEARRRSGLNLQLHVIGAGPDSAKLPSESWLHRHGEIYEQVRIRDIARECAVGCYPGDAGLSVVHYMALGLVPVVHDRLDLHMGPEPSYVIDGVNGRRFAHEKGGADLVEIIAELFADPIRQRQLAEAAYESYQSLSRPSLGIRLLQAMDLIAETEEKTDER